MVRPKQQRHFKAEKLMTIPRLDAVCKKSTGSVPRNRVFSHYATRCGTERVPPLNPASFGKLVRIIFPGISTRRLGMRGESKYHYVDLSLVDEQPDYFEGTDRGQMMRAVSCVPEKSNLKRYVRVARCWLSHSGLSRDRYTFKTNVWAHPLLQTQISTSSRHRCIPSSRRVVFRSPI